MANANRITIEISADGTAAIVGMKDVEASAAKMGSGLEGVVNAVKSNWLQLAAAVYSLKKAWDFAEGAASFKEQEIALNQLVARYKTSASAILSSLQEAAEGTLSRSQAMVVANKGLMMGLDPAQLERFTAASKRFANALGTDTADAFERLTQATAAGMERQLKGLGVLVDFQKAQRDYASSLHTVTEKLTEEERQTANVNEVLQQTDDILRRMGPDVDTAADSMQRFEVMLSGFKLTLGQIILFAGAGITALLMGISAMANGIVGAVADIIGELVSVGKVLPFVGDKFAAAGEAVKSFAKHQYAVAGAAIEMVKTSIDAANAVFKQTEAVNAGADALKKQKKEIISTTEEVQKMKMAWIEYEKSRVITALKARTDSIEAEIKKLEALYGKDTASMSGYIQAKQRLEAQAAAFKIQAVEAEITAEDKRYAALELSRASAAAKEAEERQHLTKLAELKAKINDIEAGAGQKAYEDNLRLLDAENAAAEQRRAADRANAMAALREKYDGELMFMGLSEEQKTQILEHAAENNMRISNAELAHAQANAFAAAEREKWRSGVSQAANKAMENQMLRLIEMHKFSASAFAQAIIQQVKMELVGTAAKAAVQALFFTALGLGYLAMENPLAGVAFAAAAQFAAISGATLALAAGVQAAFGGMASQQGDTGSAAGSSGGSYSSAAPSAYPADSSASQQAPAPLNVTVNVYSPLTDQNWNKIAVDNIVPAINDAVQTRQVNLVLRPA